MKESNIEKYFKDEMKRIGGISRKFTSPGRRDVPDQIGILNGFVFFVELKAHAGPTVAQKREHKRLRDHGATVYVASSFYEVNLLIKLLQEEHASPITIS